MAMQSHAVGIESASSPFPHELAAGRVFRLGGDIVLDEQISWSPRGASRRQPVNCYLIQGRSGSVLVDTGVRLHAAEIVNQLGQVLRAGEPLAIVLTRTEMECCLNIPVIEDHFEVTSVWYTGGITVPRSRANTHRIAVDPGSSTQVEPLPGITVELVSPLLRLLPTLWVHDPESGVLMTSDGFTHGWAGESSPHDGLVKFSWFAETDSRPIARDVQEIFRSHTVSAIAPSYGLPFTGVENCRAEATRLAAAIREMGLEWITV